MREASPDLIQGPRRAKTETERETDLGTVRGEELSLGLAPGPERGRRKVIRETDLATGPETDPETDPGTATDIRETGEMTDVTETRTMLTS